MQLLKDMVKFLGLKKRVELTIKTVPGEEEDAYYLSIRSDRGRLVGHEIVIFTENTERSFETLLAHELIHAWQEEKRYDENHGPKFKDMAAKMEDEFNLIDIYRSGVDLR